MGENISNKVINKGLISKIHKQFMQSILKKKPNRQPNPKKKKKMVRSSKQTFLPRRHSDGQETHEKMFITNYWASWVAYLLKNPPAMQETPVQFVGQENLLEKG